MRKDVVSNVSILLFITCQSIFILCRPAPNMGSIAKIGVRLRVLHICMGVS